MRTCTHCGRTFDGEGELCARCTLLASEPVPAERGPDQADDADDVDEEETPQLSMSRRRFLTASIVSVSGIVGVGYLGLALRYLMPSTAPAQVALQDVGPVSSFPQMSPILKVIEQDQVADGVYIVNTGKNVLALDFHCTHLNCPIAWYPGVDGIGRYICPCHGSQFSVTGEHLAGPAPRALYRHQVTIKDGRVLVGAIQA